MKIYTYGNELHATLHFILPDPTKEAIKTKEVVKDDEKSEETMDLKELTE